MKMNELLCIVNSVLGHILPFVATAPKPPSLLLSTAIPSRGAFFFADGTSLDPDYNKLWEYIITRPVCVSGLRGAFICLRVSGKPFPIETKERRASVNMDVLWGEAPLSPPSPGTRLPLYRAAKLNMDGGAAGRGGKQCATLWNSNRETAAGSKRTRNRTSNFWWMTRRLWKNQKGWCITDQSFCNLS